MNTSSEPGSGKPSPVANLRIRGAELLSEAELTHQRAVTIDIFTIKVVEQSAALTHQFHQTSAGTVIVFVQAKVFCEFSDPSRQQRDLNFRRTAVTLVCSVFLDDRGTL